MNEPTPAPRSAAQTWALLLLIVLVAALIRFPNLDSTPAGLFRDEAEKGYNAWALAHTGGVMDIPAPTPGGPRMRWRAVPWMTDIFGNRTSAIYHYASLPFMLGDAPTIAATRRASAFVGTLTVFLVGLLLMRAWGIWPGLAAAAWLALCPWHLVFSRWALEGIFVPLLVVVTLAGLFAVERRRRWGWPLVGAGMGWLFYAYSGAQPLVLGWGICILIIYRRHLFTRDALRSPFLWLGLVLFLIPVIPTLVVRLEPGGSLRMAQVAIWSDPRFGKGTLPIIFTSNYLEHFLPGFLFIHGDSQPRHSIPGMGQLTLIDAILLPVGLWFAFNRRIPLRGVLLALLLCAPIPAALTDEGIPHGLRSIAMLVPAVAFSAFGIVAIVASVHRQMLNPWTPPARARIAAGAVLCVIFLVGAVGVQRYFRIYSKAPLAQVAFEKGQRDSWQRIVATRQPGQKIYLNGYLPFTVWYQLFFTHPDAKTIGPEGPDPANFIYFDPTQLDMQRLAVITQPGDWLLYPMDASQISNPDGSPFISPENASRAGELWVVTQQRQ